MTTSHHMTTGTIIEFRPRERAGRAPVHEFQGPKDSDFEPLRRAAQPMPRKREPIEARRDAWQKASRTLEFLETLDRLRSLAADLVERNACALARQYVEPGKHIADVHWEMRDQIMAARADLILAPVVNKGQLAEKQRLLKWCRNHLPITAARIDAALAADEAYLAMPRGKRADAARGKAVRS